MAKSKLISRIGALALAAALACTSLISASAATIDKATIDMDAKAQLSIYKYDFTNAKKDGVWNERSYVSTGQYDAKVNEVLVAQRVRCEQAHLLHLVMDRQATAMQLKVSSILTQNCGHHAVHGVRKRRRSYRQPH